jgi:hypothetical protein
MQISESESICKHQLILDKKKLMIYYKKRKILSLSFFHPFFEGHVKELEKDKILSVKN